MTDTVWVVSYSMDEFTDRLDWAVAWYPTETEAAAHAAQFNSVLEEAKQRLRTWYDTQWYQFGADADAQYASLDAFRASCPAHRTLAVWLDRTTDMLDVELLNRASVSSIPRGTLPLPRLER